MHVQGGVTTVQEWGDLCSHSTRLTGCCTRVLEKTQLFDPKEAICWSNLRHEMHTIIGQLRRLMSVPLEAVKSGPVQLLASDEDLWCGQPSLRTHKRSTYEFTGQSVLLLVATVFLIVPIPLHSKDVAGVVHVPNTSCYECQYASPFQRHYLFCVLSIHAQGYN